MLLKKKEETVRKTAIDLDRYDNDTSDLELQRRSISSTNDGVVHAVFYAWLSDERKKQNHENKFSMFQPFYANDIVTKTVCGMKLRGKIMSVDCSYYDGDYHVLYVNFDKRSSKKFIDWKAKSA